jgi:hypothetical protein
MEKNKRLMSGWWDILPSGKFTPNPQGKMEGTKILDALYETMIFKPSHAPSKVGSKRFSSLQDFV